MHRQYANSALSGAPPASTFALQMLRDKQRKLELAGRMHRLWEESGHTQQAVADAIGLKHRSYQKALQTGGISYEKLASLAEFHGVELDWLLRGDENTATPDHPASDPYADQLDRIEEAVTGNPHTATRRKRPARRRPADPKTSAHTFRSRRTGE